MTAVVPVKAGSSSEDCDLERLRRLLIPSFERFWDSEDHLEFVVVAPEKDLARVEAALSGFDGLRIRVVSEDSLCPLLKGTSGWHKQQVLKLAAARLVTTRCYLTLDADVVLKKPVNSTNLITNGRPHFQCVPASHHWPWWKGSESVLKARVEYDRGTPVMDVTPAILFRDVCLDLLAEIGIRNASSSAERFLMDASPRGWTEYSLYWLYLMERNLEGTLYYWNGDQFYGGLWRHEDLKQLSPGGIEEFIRRSGGHFFVLQSTLKIPVTEAERSVKRVLFGADT